MNTVEIIFSPTGGTEKVAHIISGCWGGEVEQIDLSDAKADFSKCSIDSADMVLIAMPSFGGRAPAVAIERLKQIQGNGAKCTLVCVYGNRAYDATIAEMGIAKDTLYRWKRAAGIKLTAHRKPFELRAVNTESDCDSDFEEPFAGRSLSIISDADTAFEEDDFSEEPNKGELYTRTCIYPNIVLEYNVHRAFCSTSIRYIG